MNRSSRRPRRPAIGSWPNGWVVRQVTPHDIRAVLGSDLKPEYCHPDTKPCGYAAEKDGELRAIGVVSWDIHGRAWAWINRVGHVPAATLHRCATEFLDMMRGVGAPEIRMICNLAIPGSVKWVERLGFEPDEELQSPLGPVYRLNLDR